MACYKVLCSKHNFHCHNASCVFFIAAEMLAAEGQRILHDQRHSQQEIGGLTAGRQPRRRRRCRDSVSCCCCVCRCIIIFIRMCTKNVVV